MILGVRAYMFTIRHQVTNKTNSHNAGPLGGSLMRSSSRLVVGLEWLSAMQDGSQHVDPNGHAESA
jgi:hypothetical protein